MEVINSHGPSPLETYQYCYHRKCTYFYLTSNDTYTIFIAKRVILPVSFHVEFFILGVYLINRFIVVVIATGLQSQKTSLKSVGNFPCRHRSINDVSSYTSRPRCFTVPNQSDTFRSPVGTNKGKTVSMLTSSRIIVRQFHRFDGFLPRASRKFYLVELEMAPISSKRTKVTK